MNTAAVIQHALASAFFETGPDGGLPEGEKLEQAAQDLIHQAQLAYNVGNPNPDIVHILQLAGVDLSAGSTTPEGDIMAAGDTEQLQQQPDEMLPKLLSTLQNFEQTAEVIHNINLIQAEMTRRGLAAPETVATNENGAAMQVTAEVLGPDKVDHFLPQQATSPVDRTALLDRLSFSMMRAHGIDPSQVDSLTNEQLQWVLDHPAGAETPAPTPEPAAETPKEEPVQEGETIQTTRMVVQQPEAEVAPPAPQTPAQPAVENEREELESQITGPILKAYGRGRKDVPNLGLNELRFMIDHPEGRVDPAKLAAMQHKDAEAKEAAEAATSTEAPIPTIAEQMRAQREAEKVAEPAPEPPAPATHPDEVETLNQDTAFALPAAPVAQTQVQVPIPAPVAAPPAPPRDPRSLPSDPAHHIIERENLPVPPELDGDPPRLPADLSKCSDEEIQSYHTRFHACSSRANYLVGLWDSELRDLLRLRKGREVEVANNLPVKDGRTKYTDAQRESMVQADAEVVRLRGEEHEVEKVLRQLRLLAGNYSTDVAVCSRQHSMRHREAEGAGTLRS